MATVQDHYANVLSDVYSWMFGGFSKGVDANRCFFDKHNITASRSKIAVDLGCGCGFQSIPLAERGFSLISIDTDKKLLDELKSNCDSDNIQVVNDDLQNFTKYVSSDIELVVCMTDTILHLQSREEVSNLFEKVYDALDSEGKFVVTFRDLTFELKDSDRIIPVRSSDDTIFTCLLEYEKMHVKVNDIVYKRKAGVWSLHKSFYKKLRLSKDDIVSDLEKSGFRQIEASTENGVITVIAVK